MIARVKVLESRRLTPTTHDIKLEKPAGFAFRPVQFCGLEIETAEGGVEYPMSLATSPTRDYLEFGARLLSGSPWKKAFGALQAGDTVEIDGAYGHFVLDETRDAVLVAGGIGITPLKGMAEYATDMTLPIDVALLYSNRSLDEVAYRDEIDALAAANGRLTALYTLTREEPPAGSRMRKGRIDRAMLAEALAAHPDAVFYVCGRDEMVRDAFRTLLELKVDAKRVRYEVFSGYE
ncbi:MAG: ferredoxin--NADP reductase [Thermoplasmatota archaeon]